MTTYTKSFPGAPTSGLYAFGDIVTDSLGVRWQCVEAGIPGKFAPTFFSAASLPGAVVGTGIVAEEYGSGTFHFTKLTLTAKEVTVTDALAYGSTQLYDFPEGRFLILGGMASLTLAVPAPQVRADTINDNSTVDWALGTVAASNVALTGTMVDLVAIANEAAFAATGNGFGTAATAVLASSAVFDGTATPKDMFLNFGFSDATDIDADAIISVSGTISVVWVMVGDF